MSPEQWAIGVLVVYACLAAGMVVWQIKRSEVGWRVWLLYCSTRIYCGLMYRWRSNRRCPFTAAGPAIIIANHRSPVDPMLIWMNNHFGRPDGKARVIVFLMAREYYEVRGIHWISKTLQSIPLERDGQDMAPVRKAYRDLQAGKLIAIFPEGGINLNDQLREAGTGVAWLALKARVPVYPVFIQGSPGGSTMVEPFYRPSRVKVLYGDPIDLTEYYDLRKSHQVLQEVTDLLMTRLAQLGHVSYARQPADARETLPLDRGTG